MTKRTRQGSLFLPLILIAFGIIFLLNNFGKISWDVWGELIRLWPIFLIAAGLDLILGRGFWRWWFTLLIVVILAGGVFTALELGLLAGWGTVKEPASQGLAGAERAKVELACEQCVLTIGSSDNLNALLEGTITRSRNESLIKHVATIDGALNLSLSTRGIFVPSHYLSPTRDVTNRTWKLYLNRSIPIDLVVNVEQGAITLDLSRLAIPQLKVTGIDDITVTFPDHGFAQATIRGESGDITLSIPQSAAVRIDATLTGIGELQLPDTYVLQNGVYVSPNYDEAEECLNIVVRNRDGSIRIVNQ